MTAPSRFPSSRAAFTLIELLVVIAILALLVSILLPSLQKAQEIAHATICQTQLRGLSSANQLYAESNDGWLPPVTYPNYYRWPAALQGHAHRGLPGGPDYIPRTSNGGGADNPIFRCPSEQTRWRYNSVGDYGMNYWMTYYGDKIKGTQARWIHADTGYRPDGSTLVDFYQYNLLMTFRPGDMFLMGDSISSFGDWPVSLRMTSDPNTDPVSSRYRPQYRHVGHTANIVFHDGHVESFTWQKTPIWHHLYTYSEDLLPWRNRKGFTGEYPNTTFP
jgi:prepilin-type N-terminal cleavage/methylation domain-containing protein/prepilin-type processing-associated H-X9-DG protein